jgi:hypothetical protein
MTYTDQFYQDAGGKVYFLSAQDQANVAAPGWTGPVLPDPAWTAITAAQASAITNPPPTLAQLLAYASAQAQVLLATMGSYTAGATVIKSDATPATLTDWMALQQWAADNPTATTQWVANDNTVTALPATAVGVIAPLVGGFSQAVYQALATILSAIAAGTITTTAAIDAASWPAMP